jgi:hypothetical protein
LELVPRSVPEVKIGAGKSCKEEGQDHNNQNDSWSIRRKSACHAKNCPRANPLFSPMTKIVTAPVTHDIMINTLTQLPEEAKVNDKDEVAKYVHRGLEGITTLLYDWASHPLTLHVGYKTPMLSDTDDNLFAVFKTIVDEFSPEEEKRNETYPETGKHVLQKRNV